MLTEQAPTGEVLPRPVNLGFIGYGTIASVHHDAIRRSEGNHFNVVGLVDPRYRPTGEDDVRLYHDIEQLLQDSAIEAVSINTPPNTHKVLVEKALRAGKHVLVEKPPALTVGDIESMVEAADQTGKVLYFAWHAAQHEPVRAAAKELVGQDITGIEIEYKEDVLKYHDKGSWVFKKEVAGGGILMDSGINAISAVTHMLPGVQFTIQTADLRYPDSMDVETSADVRFSFGNNVPGHLNMDWRYQRPEGSDGPEEVRRTTIRTATGDTYTFDAVADQLLRNGIIIAGNPAGGSAKVDIVAEYEGVYAEFTHCIASGKSSVSVTELQFVQDSYVLSTRQPAA